MEIESRRGTLNKYATQTFRLDGKLQKRYIGKASDPVVQLFFESEQLDKAVERADRETRRREKDDDLAAARSLDWLAQWSTNWKVISELRGKNMHKKPTPSCEAERELPRLHRFKETCRRSEDGDLDAQRQLDIWIAETPEILSRATDTISIVREYLIQFVGRASPECSVLWRKQLDLKTAEIMCDAGDDALSRMYAEVAVLAWFDFMRSSLMPCLAGGDMKRSAYWGSALTLSQKRWLSIEKAFRQHLKQAPKLRSANQSIVPEAKKKPQPG
ncbi:hypothetical protein [Rubripirellula reticaptiva]|uniref:Uncharacterized protein n=1 Tax=Rubripirellula reticaptiva TaxID=2528013 RepID=A0A5C6ESR1_9BACT|nr:hypothetical protein [Rubripirellula reticaptiva]TWU51147.1 hypothetical protein Poly59_27370 [Rubripirellula reticaptiva]